MPLLYLLQVSNLVAMRVVEGDSRIRNLPGTRPFFGFPFATARRLGLRNDSVFKFGQRGEKFTGLERLNDVAIGPHSPGFFALEWLHLADGEQDRNFCGLTRFF